MVVMVVMGVMIMATMVMPMMLNLFCSFLGQRLSENVDETLLTLGKFVLDWQHMENLLSFPSLAELASRVIKSTDLLAKLPPHLSEVVKKYPLKY